MKALFFQLILVYFFSSIFGQTDSVFAVNVFEHEILENGRATMNKTVIQQDTYNLEGQKIRTVFYEGKTISGYIFYFYDDEKLISREVYNKQFAIDTVQRFHYNSEGKKTKEVSYNIEGSSEKLISVSNFDVFNNKVRITKTLNNKGKWIERYKYHTNDTITTLTIKFKSGTHPENLKIRTVMETYSGENLIRKQVISNYKNKEEKSYTLKYEYVEGNPMPSKISKFNNVDSLLSTTNYNFNSQGIPVRKRVLDSNGNYLEYKSFDARFFKTQLSEQKMYKLKE